MTEPKNFVGRYATMARSAPLKPATILIVENEALVRLELAAALADMGFIVLQAENADDAIALLETHPRIAILVTDITMPGSMDGLRLAHHVRGRWPPVKIVVLSGLLDTQLSELPEDSLFVPKPYDARELWPALARMAGETRSHAASR
jgi:CheY-like chemotaxis protein